MKQWILGLLIGLSMAACKKQGNPNCTDEQYSYSFSNGKQVDTVRSSPTTLFAVVNPGSKMVFQYNYNSEVCSNIADHGYQDRLVFEVPAGATSFNYDTPGELEAGMCYFQRSCFCGDVSSRVVTGMIKGLRMNAGEWSIQVNVTDPVRNLSLSFNKTFEVD